MKLSEAVAEFIKQFEHHFPEADEWTLNMFSIHQTKGDDANPINFQMGLMTGNREPLKPCNGEAWINGREVPSSYTGLTYPEAKNIEFCDDDGNPVTKEAGFAELKAVCERMQADANKIGNPEPSDAFRDITGAMILDAVKQQYAGEDQVIDLMGRIADKHESMEGAEIHKVNFREFL